MCTGLEVHEKWTQRVAEFKKTHADWTDVMGKSKVEVYCLVEMHIMMMPNGPAIAYFLARHPEVAKKMFDSGLHASIDAISLLSVELERSIP